VSPATPPPGEAELRRLRAALRAAQLDLQQQTRRAETAEAERDALLQSLSWRVTAPLRQGAAALRRRGLRAPADAASTLAHDPTHYARWVAACDTLTPADRAAIGAHIARFAQRPLISVVLPVYETQTALLQAAIASVRAQLYPHWELCIADDASPSPQVGAALAAAAATEPRLRWVRRSANGNISAASNSALELAQGEFVALLDHDDLLAETALYEIAAALDAAPETDLLFSDEDHLVETAGGGTRRQHPYFKPGFDPELLLGQNAISHLGVYRRSLLTRIGGFRLGFEGSQDHDLALRAVAATTPARIRHIPAILYHWRQRGDASFSDTQLARCIDAAHRAIGEHVAGLPGGEGALVRGNPWHRALHRVAWPLPDPAPLASLLLPAEPDPATQERVLTELLEATDYRAIEVILTQLGDAPSLPARFAGDTRLRCLALPVDTSPAGVANAAAAAAQGEVLVLLAAGIAVTEPGWLEELVSQALRPDIGTVGARLVGPGNRLRHAGFVLHPDGVSSFGRDTAGSDAGYGGELVLARTVAANSAAGLAIRRGLFETAGGFDAAALPTSGYDLDLGLRLRAAGQRNIWTPFAELLRPAVAPPEDRLDAAALATLRHRWPQAFVADPAANANLDRSAGTPCLPIPARRHAPWRPPRSGGST
jgi:O-antigen biosynthesis protein